LVPGASEGAGLGTRFLRHVDRTRVLLHLVTLDPAEDRDPLKDYDTLRNELGKFDSALAQRPEVVVISKADITEVKEEFESIKREFEKRGITPLLFSAVTRDGLKDVVGTLRDVLEK
jgi:GTP-binding protein